MLVNPIQQAVKLALEEDLGSGDITGDLINPTHLSKAQIITREEAILCGISWVNEVYFQLENKVLINWHSKEGHPVKNNEVICEMMGPTRLLLSGERTALNFLQTLSGTATTTHLFVTQLKNSKTSLLDTRKTLPGLRFAQKYAVQCGGGKNHRMGLYDAFLIKENHIMACGSITKAVEEARKKYSDKKIEVEVENLEELEEALANQVEIVMLDNFDLPKIKEAVALTAGRAKLEVSGGVSVDSLKDLANLGVDYISVGALTKHVRAIDFSMRIVTHLHSHSERALRRHSERSEESHSINPNTQ